jgi:hypothetical protein
MNRFAKFSVKAATLLGVVSTVMLGGCYDDSYYARRDGVTLGAGDAVHVNKVTHTIDPWPPHAQNDKIDPDAKRMGLAIQRYQQNRSIEPRGLNTTTAAEPGANGNAAIKK